jgi:phosphatidylglycerophosphatase A
MWQDWHRVLALGFGLGLLPKAPGTWGTLLGFLLYDLMRPLPPFFGWIMAGFLVVLGCRVCSVTADALGVSDPGVVVWDEVVAFALLLYALQPVTLGQSFFLFVFFRFLDMTKPMPIGWFDRHVTGGIGIMLDDLVVSVMVWLGWVGLRWMGYASS